MAKLATPTG